MVSRGLVLLVAVSVMLIWQVGETKPAAQESTSTGRGPQSVGLEQVMNSGGEFFRDLGELVTGLVNMGLKSASALITTGSQATQQVAVAVGSAALPSLFNVSRTLESFQKNGASLLNETRQVLPNTTVFRDVATSVVRGISPAIQEVSQAIQRVGRPSAPRPSTISIDEDIPIID